MSEKLNSLLSKDDVSDYPGWFREIANELLFNSYFLINNVPYSIHEIEFYVTDEKHPDPFTHKKDEQKTSSKFYFHKLGNSYKEGNYKGLDITCGSRDRHGGIIIRGIKNVETGEYIDGPSNVVQKILDTFQKEKVKDFAEKDPESIVGERISIKASSSTNKEGTVWTPRVGLTLKKNLDEKLGYIVREYRVLRNPIETKKGLKFIDASLILNECVQRNKTRATSLEKINQLLEQGRGISLLDELFLTEASDENDLIKLYGFNNK